MIIWTAERIKYVKVKDGLEELHVIYKVCSCCLEETLGQNRL